MKMIVAQMSNVKTIRYDSSV